MLSKSLCTLMRSNFQYPRSVGMKGKSKAHARKKHMWPIDDDDIYGSSYDNDSSSADMAATYPLPINRKYSGIGLAFSNKDKERIKPRNPTQAGYMNLLGPNNPSIVLAVGPAGTGKTMIACHIGLQKLVDNEISKLILTRPAVSVEEQHGFLPGTLEEKMEPWLKPIYDIMYQYFSVAKVQQLIKSQIIEICPLAYMRGRTFENSWIIADEAQNMTPNQMLMLLTRIGNKSKMIITGDPNQHDRGFEVNGLNDLIKRMRYYKDSKIGLVEFTENDVERHPIIKTVLKLYKNKTIGDARTQDYIANYTNTAETEAVYTKNIRDDAALDSDDAYDNDDITGDRDDRYIDMSYTGHEEHIMYELEIDDDVNRYRANRRTELD